MRTGPVRGYSFIAFVLLIWTLVASSCRDEKFAVGPDARVEFSTDTLSFDTVFVTLGSTTEYFSIRNKSRNALLLRQVVLAGGTASFFRMNVDGEPGDRFENIEIPPRDSILVFVEVTVDPGAGNLPFLITDSIFVQTDAGIQSVKLIAYGQNANFFNGEELETQTWVDTLPYVVLNSVLVKEGHTLTIREGTEVYFGGNSALFVQGTLKILGMQDSMVTLRGVRLDDIITGTPYDEIPGQWTGVFLLRGSRDNEIRFAEIRNGQFGISLGSTTLDQIPNISEANAPDLRISNSIIRNISVFSLFGLLSEVDGENLLFYDCGSNMLAFQLGGDYTFRHCTFYNRGSSYLEHQEAVLYGSNYFYDPGQGIFGEADLDMEFTNCIIYGTEADEIVIDTVPPSLSESDPFINAYFQGCLLRTTHTQDTNFNGNILNADPLFMDVIERDLHLTMESPCVDAGIDAGVPFDLEGMPRIMAPDIGCFEFQ